MFLWRCGRRSGPSLEHWGDVAVLSDPVRRGSPGTASEWVRRWTCKPLWTDCARGRDLVGVEAAPWWRGLGRHDPQDGRDLGVRCRGLEWAADRGYSVRTQWPVIPAIPCPSRYGADRGYSVRTQWPVIPAVPCPSRYGADATLGRVGHSVALSRRPAEIAGVVEALMGHDTLSGGSVEAGGDGLRATQPRATRRLGPRAIRRMYPCRGLPWRASGETETAPPAEARRPLPRPTLGSLARGGVRSETSCSRLEARWRRARSRQVRGPWLTF